MRRLPTNPLVLLLGICWLVACSSSDAPTTAALDLRPVYHLKAVDGVFLPIQSTGGGTLDSGHVRRLGGDTVQVDSYGHGQGVAVITTGTWAATQFGDTVVLFPILSNSQDTAFVGAGDTLTLHTRVGGLRALHIEVYVAP